jgi:hypothetical protein
MEAYQASIPITGELLQKIYDLIDDIHIADVASISLIKELIVSSLTRLSQPILVPINVSDSIIDPEIVSDWVDNDTKSLWHDCLGSIIFDKLSEPDTKLLIATWSRDGLPEHLSFSSQEICGALSVENRNWLMPIVAEGSDWDEYCINPDEWPTNLIVYIEKYGRRVLKIGADQLVNHKGVKFVPSCLHDLSKEGSSAIRNQVVEIIACKAYNMVKPEHNDETIEGQPGIRRVSVNKMNPAVRLHYYQEHDELIYTIYSNGEHDKGLG